MSFIKHLAQDLERLVKFGLFSGKRVKNVRAGIKKQETEYITSRIAMREKNKRILSEKNETR